MDPSAPQTVLKGVAITSSLCGVAAGIYGGFRNGTPNKFFLYSAVNSGIVAATFFSIREYVVGPALVLTLPGKQYELRRQRLLHAVPEALSWSDIRISHLLDSGISGGLAGGILNGLKRGRHGLVPGLATGALMCTLFQWCFNELNILRIRYVSTNLVAASTHPAIHNLDLAESSTPRPTTSESSVAHPTMNRILSMFGQRVSDEQYLQRLKVERDSCLRRIAELEGKKEQ